MLIRYKVSVHKETIVLLQKNFVEILNFRYFSSEWGLLMRVNYIKSDKK